jgi:elongation factor Ts
MAEITATSVKALREDTGLGMMECKKALTETHGDIAAAKDLLRKKGLTTAEKKAGRTTSEGLVVIKVNPQRTEAAMVEVRCETDFCSRNDEFKKMVDDVAGMVFAAPAGKVEASDAITACVQATLAKIGENMGYTQGVKIAAPRIGSYVHHNGKVGVVVGIEGELDDETLSGICMHVAFADPLAITTDQVPADLVAKEKEIAIGQAMASGKPKDIAEKMVTGKLRKYLEANALLEQPFVRDDSKKVKEILGAAKITAFARFAVGSTK